MLANPFNWISVLRAFIVFTNPLRFFLAIARGKALPDVVVRTPVGRVRIELRNFESSKTIFSVFCRRDYLTAPDGAFLFLDVGANVGIASLYFLTRNASSRVICFEPDRANLSYLQKNLQPFASRAEIRTCALGVEDGAVTFFRSEDGKYSSLIRSEKATVPDQIECRRFAGILREACSQPLPVVVKLDVEGIELDLVRSVDWSEFPRVHRLISESTECGAAVGRQHSRRLRSGYVEDLVFADGYR